MTISAKNAHKIDLTTLGGDDLRHLAESLERSIADKQQAAVHWTNQATVLNHTRTKVLPAYAAMLEQLAERAPGIDPTAIATVCSAIQTGDLSIVPTLHQHRAFIGDDAPISVHATAEVPQDLQALLDHLVATQQAHPHALPQDPALALFARNLPTMLAHAIHTGLALDTPVHPAATPDDAQTCSGEDALYALSHMVLESAEDMEFSLDHLRLDLLGNAYAGYAQEAQKLHLLAQQLHDADLPTATA